MITRAFFLLVGGVRDSALAFFSRVFLPMQGNWRCPVFVMLSWKCSRYLPRLGVVVFPIRNRCGEVLPHRLETLLMTFSHHLFFETLSGDSFGPRGRRRPQCVINFSRGWSSLETRYVCLSSFSRTINTPFHDLHNLALYPGAKLKYLKTL